MFVVVAVVVVSSAFLGRPWAAFGFLLGDFGSPRDTFGGPWAPFGCHWAPFVGVLWPSWDIASLVSIL